MGPRPLHELSLFSGYGGFSLGLRLAGLDVRTVCYVEREPYAQAVIRARIADGHLDDAPLWDDVRTFDGGPWSGAVDIVTAGFPCQPHFIAGRRAGDADERNLWPDTLRVVREVRPHYVLLENAGIDLRDGVAPAYAYTVLADLAGIGYDARWASVPAAAVGAPHLRWRWWCLAYSGGVAAPTEPLPEPRSNGAPEPGRHGEAGTLAHPDRGAGTSIENRALLARADMLRRVNASVRFLSIEPLLEPMGRIDLTGIHWVIVGGESGGTRRPFDPAWAREIRDQCTEQGVAFFYKQGGGFKPGLGRELDGRTWDEYPQVTKRQPEGQAALPL